METFNSISSLRAIAIFQVVILHVFSLYIHYATESIFYIPFVFQIVSSGVPLFIFISGFNLSFKYWDDFSVITFYKKRFKNLLFPYAFFCIIYILLPSVIERKSIDFSYEDFINILFNPGKFFYHFWFIGLISSFYLFYPLFVKIFIKFKDNLFYVLLVSVFIQIIWMKTRVFVIYNLEILRNIIFLYDLLFWLINYLFLRQISYFVLGVYISKNLFRISSNSKFLYTLIIPIILLPLLNIILHEVTLSVLLNISIILFYFVLLGERENIFLKLTAKYSFGIYLIHALVLHYVVKTLNMVFNYWYFYLYTIIITFSISFTIIYGLSKLPKSHYFIGNTNR